MRLRLERHDGAGQVETVPLVSGRYACREGDRLILTVEASRLATLRMGGDTLPPTAVFQEGHWLCVRYVIEVLTWAGCTPLTVEAEGSTRRLVLDVAPHPGKLGLDAFAELLMELEDREAGITWGLAPGDMAGTIGGPTPLVTFPAVLEVLLPLLAQAVSRYRHEAPLTTRRGRAVTPLSLARRPDTRTLRWIATHMRARVGLGVDETGATFDFASKPPLVDQPVVRTTIDHPVTRHLAHMLVRVRRMAEAAAEEFTEVAGGLGEPEARARANSLAALCRNSAGEITEWLRMPPFRGVMPHPAGEGALQALADLPAAAATHRLCRRLIAAGLALGAEGDALAGLKHTYDLYEVAVLYRLADAVQALLGHGWKRRETPWRGGGVELRPPARIVWRQGGWLVRLEYQRTFPAHDKARGPWRSISKALRPDYLLAVERDGIPIGWIVLDAKYRASRTAVLEGLRDVHVYRDALRWQGCPPAAAFVLAPAVDPGVAVFAKKAYRETQKFGVIVSGGASADLAIALGEMLVRAGAPMAQAALVS